MDSFWSFATPVLLRVKHRITSLLQWLHIIQGLSYVKNLQLVKSPGTPSNMGKWDETHEFQDMIHYVNFNHGYILTMWI